MVLRQIVPKHLFGIEHPANLSRVNRAWCFRLPILTHSLLSKLATILGDYQVLYFVLHPMEVFLEINHGGFQLFMTRLVMMRRMGYQFAVFALGLL